MRRRTKAREFAVQFLYQLDLRGPDAAPEVVGANVGAGAADVGANLGAIDAFLDAAEEEDFEAAEAARAAKQEQAGEKPGSAQVERVRRTVRRDKELREFALRLIEGTRQQQKEVDQILVAVTRNWDLRRMAAIDRNILRMAIYELLHCADIPPKVTINEAIELGKRFSTANSGSFINGILDRVRIDIDKGAVLAPARPPLEQSS